MGAESFHFQRVKTQDMLLTKKSSSIRLKAFNCVTYVVRSDRS